MWPQIALAAAPVVMDMLTPHPAYPGGPSVSMPVMPDRTQYVNQVLSSGFNPQDQLYRLASDQVADQVRAHLARMGLGGSSYGFDAMSNAQTDLGNKFAAQELQRRIQAMQLVNQMDQYGADLQFRVNAANSSDAMNRFNYENQKRDAMIGGFSNLAAAGANMYQANQTRNEQAAIRAQNQANFERIYGPINPQPQYGVPGYMPSSADFQMPTMGRRY